MTTASTAITPGNDDIIDNEATTKEHRDAVVNSNKGKMRKRLPTSGEESSDDNGTTTRVSKKQWGNAGNANEGVPVVRGNKSAAVQKVLKVRPFTFIWYSINNLLHTERERSQKCRSCRW